MCADGVLNMVYSFVCAESVRREDESDDARPPKRARNVLYPGIFATFGPNSFKHFDQFCMTEGFPYSAVFITEREFCRFCGAKLTICKNHKDVVVYHLTRGAYLGSRFTKKCSKCKTKEHYGHYKKEGELMGNV